MEKEHEEEERSIKGIIFFVSRIVLSLVLALLGAFLLNEERVGLGWNLFVMLIAYGIIAYDILYKAFKNIVFAHEWFDECFLMAIASIGAFVLRAYGPTHNEFLEAILVIWLYQLGEFFSDLAADKSKEAILSSIDIREEKALIEVDGTYEEVEAESIKKGDSVKLLAGRKVYCDGVVKQGQAEINESSLTGESLPVHKQIGDLVYSGTTVNEGTVVVQATCDYSDSTSARLMNLIEEGAEEKSKATRFITKFAKIYTPIVIGLAILIAVIPPLFLGINSGEVWSRWIYVALSLLVISCPCAIVISVPLAYFTGLGLASKNGILVKGASYFDALTEIKAIAFDKTGTLTKGEIVVKKVVLIDEKYLHLLARAESLSTHPLGRAVSSLFPNEKASDKDEIKEVPGKGIIANIEGHKIVAGNESLLRENGCQESLENDFMGIHFMVDNLYQGKIVCQDEYKANSKQIIQELHGFGVKSYVFSGDKKSSVSSVSEALGCDGYKAEMLPEEKQDGYRSLKEECGGVVAFCGDGINDAPTLALSDVGIAMGKAGSDATLDNADVVIIDDNLHKIVTLLSIVKLTRKTAIIDIVIPLLVKGAVAALSLVAALTGAFALPLWAAVLADSGLASIMVLISLSLYFRHPK